MPVYTYTALEQMTAAKANTYALNNGLKFVASQTSSANPNGFEMYNVFTSEFDAYRIVLSQLFTYNTTPVTLTMQMATGGTTPYTGAAYQSASLGTQFNGTAATAFGSNTTSWSLLSLYQNGLRSSRGVIVINARQVSEKPTCESMFVDVGASSLSNGKNYMAGGFLNNAATYTGFKIFSPTYSINGTCVVYGYRKA